MLPSNNTSSPESERDNLIRERATKGELIAIFALLTTVTSLLIPIWQTLRGRQEGATCLANLRRIGQATALYLQDNDETFPPAWTGCVGDAGWYFTTWHSALASYTGVSIASGKDWSRSGGGLWHCPTDRTGNNISYGANALIGGAFALPACRRIDRSPQWMDSQQLSKLRNPAQIIWAGDTTKEWEQEEETYGAVFADWMRPTDGPLLGHTPQEVRRWFEIFLDTDYTDTRGDCPYPGRYGCKGPAYRHNRSHPDSGGASVLFCDGHAAILPFGTLCISNLMPDSGATQIHRQEGKSPHASTSK